MNDSLHTAHDSQSTREGHSPVRFRVQLWVTLLWAIVFIGSAFILAKRIILANAVRPEDQNVPAVYFDMPSEDFAVLPQDETRKDYRIPVGTAWVEAKTIPKHVLVFQDYAIVLSWDVSGKGYVQTSVKSGILTNGLDGISDRQRERLAVVSERANRSFAAELVRSSGQDVVVYDRRSIALIAVMLASTLIWLAMQGASLIRWIRRRQRVRRGKCGECAYPKLATGVKCPECGLDY